MLSLEYVFSFISGQCNEQQISWALRLRAMVGLQEQMVDDESEQTCINSGNLRCKNSCLGFFLSGRFAC